MAKVISQDTFNDVVKENIVEFDMQPDEAKEETIKQFEAQVSVMVWKQQKCSYAYELKLCFSLTHSFMLVAFVGYQPGQYY